MRASSQTFLVMLLATATFDVPREAVGQCNGGEENPPDIVGSWEWVDTWGGLAGNRFTPDSVGYAIQVEFLKTGTMREYRDRTLVRTTSYTLVRGSGGWTVILGADSAFPHPPFSHPTEFFCVATADSPDGLVLRAIDNCADCYSSTYSPRDPVPVSELSWGDVKKQYKKPE
jgi:hypothetical protein